MALSLNSEGPAPSVKLCLLGNNSTVQNLMSKSFAFYQNPLGLLATTKRILDKSMGDRHMHRIVVMSHISKNTRIARNFLTRTQNSNQFPSHENKK